VVASFAFNGSGSVAVTIHGDGAYRIAADEVCEAVVPLAALDSCVLSNANATVVLALFYVAAPPRTVAATTVALGGAVVAGSGAAAVAASASAAGSMQRALTELRIAQCGGSGGEPLVLAESILQLRMGTDALSYRRGAVVGNVVFLAAVAAAAAVMVQQRARGVLRRGGATTGLAEAAAAMRLPAALAVAYVPLLQPTVTSAVALLVESSRGADVTIGLLGAAACAAPIAWLWFRVLLRRPFGAVAHAAAATDGFVCRRGAVALLSRRHRWRDRVRGSLFVLHYGAVFEGFIDGRQWFVLVDLGMEAVCGVLGALVDLPTQQGSRCFALKVAMVAVAVAYAAAVAALRPSNTAMDAAVTAVNAAMGAAVAVAVLLLSPDVGAQLSFAQGIAALATAVLPLAVFVLSGRARRRVVALLRCGARGETPL
jgi:hypothetical protein